MGMQYTHADLEFLRRFAAGPEGKAFVELLQRNLAEADKRLRSAIGEDVLRSQGRAQLLAELIVDVTEAEKRLKRADTTRGSVARAVAWTGES